MHRPHVNNVFYAKLRRITPGDCMKKQIREGIRFLRIWGIRRKEEILTLYGKDDDIYPSIVVLQYNGIAVLYYQNNYQSHTMP